MRGTVESLVKKILRKAGIEISYVSPDYKPELYDTILTASVSVQPSFNIIQVGANDGKYNDPIYDFVREYKNRTNIVLIEPQDELIPYLKENYSYHPSSEVYNKAIGTSGSTIQLYRVGEKYWDEIDVDYGDDWPDYRVPTGVTTSNKEQLVDWISKHVRTESQPDEIIEQYDVDVIRPSTIISRSQIIDEVHLLQVDTEGLDDEVVYTFFDDEVYPRIINIKSKHLAEKQKDEFEGKLLDEGYDIYNYTAGETLALRSVFDN